MSQVSQLSPELARGVLLLARSLAAAARNWSLYPPEHPTIDQSIRRLADTIRQSSLGGAFSLGITPDTLLVEGVPAGREAAIAETAAFLHERDLLQLAFIGDVPPDALRGLLRLLSLDTDERRRRGGPAGIWAADGHPSIVVEQIDYEKVLAREEAEVPEPAKRDDLWRSIVLAIASGQKTFDDRSQQRLLAIAGSPADIRDLATAVMAPKCAVDGSPMITTQAAVVLAAYRHLTSIVSVMEPERLSQVMGNLAAASAELDPHVVMAMMQSEDDPHQQVQIVRGLAGAFDDAKVAQLLATALALEGQASDRLATIVSTIAPDEERKRRVLTLARHLLAESDFGRSDKFQVLWTSMEQLLVSYNEKPFVSESYRTALDGVGARAEQIAAADAPPQLAEWMETLGQDSVRRLSVTMLIDLLRIERDAARAEALAYDLEALAEDLLLAGAYEDAQIVVRALAERAVAAGAIGRDAARRALDTLGESPAMHEAATAIGDVDEPTWDIIRTIVEAIGPAAVEALKPLLLVETESAATVRASAAIAALGAPAVMRLASVAGDPRWFAQRNAARLLGRIASPDGVPLLQPLLRKPEARVVREAIRALSAIDDPAAARAIHTVLRAAVGDARRAVIDALVADRDARVVPMLARILADSEALGADHQVALDTIDAIAAVGHPAGVPPVAAAIRRRSWLRRRKLRAVKERGVAALAAIGGDAGRAAIHDAMETGDRMLRRIAAARRD